MKDQKKTPEQVGKGWMEITGHINSEATEPVLAIWRLPLSQTAISEEAWLRDYEN
jgi:hypothetical protein